MNEMMMQVLKQEERIRNLELKVKKQQSDLRDLSNLAILLGIVGIIALTVDNRKKKDED